MIIEDDELLDLDHSLRLLADDHADNRWLAAIALGALGDPAAVPPLEARLQDPDEGVRSAVRGALKKLGRPAPRLRLGLTAGHALALRELELSASAFLRDDRTPPKSASAAKLARITQDRGLSEPEMETVAYLHIQLRAKLAKVEELLTQGGSVESIEKAYETREFEPRLPIIHLVDAFEYFVETTPEALLEVLAERQYGSPDTPPSSILQDLLSQAREYGCDDLQQMR